MNPFLTMWRVLVSPFLAVAWAVTWLLLTVGWGIKEGRKFTERWKRMLEDDDGPVTGGPLPPDPLPTRERGEGIG